jgi:hypothetical protein
MILTPEVPVASNLEKDVFVHVVEDWFEDKQHE